MARLEAAIGLRATYYVGYTKRIDRLEKIAQLKELNHEVGYHYGTLTLTGGNPQRAMQLFCRHLKALRTIVPVTTVSAHGSPLTPWDNRDLWQHCSLSDFGLAGEASMSMPSTNYYYFTDTGRTWDPFQFNIRDFMDGRTPSRSITDTDDLIRFLLMPPAPLDCPLIINTHPLRWSMDHGEWMVSAASDWAINRIKRMVGHMRSRTEFRRVRDAR